MVHLKGRVGRTFGALIAALSMACGAMAQPCVTNVDKTGQIVDRVQLPDGTLLAGFGPKGLVYLLAQKNGTTVTIERAVLSPH